MSPYGLVVRQSKTKSFAEDSPLLLMLAVWRRQGLAVVAAAFARASGTRFAHDCFPD